MRMYHYMIRLIHNIHKNKKEIINKKERRKTTTTVTFYFDATGNLTK